MANKPRLSAFAPRRTANAFHKANGISGERLSHLAALSTPIRMS